MPPAKGGGMEIIMKKIKVAIVGLGNCASSLIQGLYYYDNSKKNAIGLMHETLGGYTISDIEVVLAIDIDARKVGKDISEAIYSSPNCTKVFCDNVPQMGKKVQMGVVMDGVSPHTTLFSPDIRVVIANEKEPSKEELVKKIQEFDADMLINYLPVGSTNAVEFYAECALEAGVGFINCMPVFIASNPEWIEKFRKKGLPCIGDDIKSQLGATIVHRELIRLFESRGIKVEHTYQLNTGGNTDFLNMLNRERLKDKKISKTMAVQSNLDNKMEDCDIHVGPSDFVEWQKDNKICFLRIEGRQFGDVPMNLELRLSVEDSPNSAGVVIDAIRCMKIALDNKLVGDIVEPSSYFMKHPRVQCEDFYGRQQLELYIEKYSK